MQVEIRQLVQAIHDCQTRIVLVTAGAGTQALSDLLGVAGATRTLLEAIVPYSEASFTDFLGQTPRKFVDPNTARLLAGRALTRARWLESNKTALVGVACTATIVTDRPKRGQHRAHIALWKASGVSVYSLQLKKGARNRTGEEDMVSCLLLNALAKACGLPLQLSLNLLPGDRLETEKSDLREQVEQLGQGQMKYFGIRDNGRILTTSAAPTAAILSGAFNPLHEGHLALAHAASSMLGKPVTPELSAINADKPPLSADVILDRMAQFAGRWPVLISTAPTFLEKARLFPGATFVIGIDTAERILHPRYYENSRENMLAALAQIRGCGCDFLVAGRTGRNGAFLHLHDLQIPDGYGDLFRPIPSDQFRRDISSTQLREAGQRGSR